MIKEQKISLLMAILVNISVMFGVGVFINTVTLAQRAGGVGFLSYLIIAILMIPLIISIGKLLAFYPVGGFYAYAARPLSPFMGFISAWSYFIGKLGSAALIIDVFSKLIKTIVPALDSIPAVSINLSIIALFTVLNMFNVKTNLKVIYTFVVLKFIPVLSAIIASISVCKYWKFPCDTLYWSHIPSAIPIVLYAFVGFEAACSISRTIQNPEKNGPKALFYSFGIVICITTLYQFLFFLPLGTVLIEQKNYLGAFPALLNLVFSNEKTVLMLTKFLHICAAAAALGGSYGILFSNHWNLYTLAENNHTFFAPILTKLNNYRIPVLCVFIEACLCIGYLLYTQGNQLLLQQISVLGCAISYIISIISLITLQHKTITSKKEKIISYVALGSCTIFIGTCIKNLLADGPQGLVMYSTMVALGAVMFYIKHLLSRGTKFSTRQLT